MKSKETLCWKCSKSCGNCSWSERFQPVKGWTAIKTRLYCDRGEYNDRTTESYIVIDCPLFDDDTAQYGQPIKLYPRDTPIVTITRPYRPRVAKGSLRDKIWNLPDLHERIERLDGKCKEIARLAFLHNNTYEDMAGAMYLSIEAVRVTLWTAMKKMEAM